MSKLHVFLADDHTVLREGLRLLINTQPDMEVVGEASDGKEAWQYVKELQPDVIVMDLAMSGWNGVQATERLKLDCPTVKILVLTAYEDQDYLRQALKAGASGYMLKSAAAEELTHAIRRIATGGTYLDPSLAGPVVNNYIRKPSGAGNAPGAATELSDREAEVLRLIAWGHTNKEIATQLSLSVNTIETYKSRLMEKLDLHSRVDIVRYALRRGWLQEN